MTRFQIIYFHMLLQTFALQKYYFILTYANLYAFFRFYLHM